MFTNPSNNNQKKYFMNLALNQARINLGNTKQNPSVGCVVVKSNHVISSSCTGLNGRPHAEHNALYKIKKKSKDLVLYLTLEPCSNFGLTPPCVNLIIKKKVRKVHFSIRDPDLRSFNKATKKLRNHGINVSEGLLSREINSFYKSYVKYKKNELPFVTCKVALSKDFNTVDKRGRFITNKYSRGRVHLMRSIHDCVITSSKTINKDNSRLTCRINGLISKSPARIILDKDLKIRVKSKILEEASSFKTIIFYNKENKRKINNLEKYGVKFYKISIDVSGKFDLEKTLIKAKKLGFSRIFIEAGLELTSNFLKNNLVDDLKIFLSNKILGLNGTSNFKENIKKILKNKKSKVEKVNLLGEKLITYRLK